MGTNKQREDEDYNKFRAFVAGWQRKVRAKAAATAALVTLATGSRPSLRRKVKRRN